MGKKGPEAKKDVYKYKNGIYLCRWEPVFALAVSQHNPTTVVLTRSKKKRAAALLQDAFSPPQINYFLEETQLNGARNIRGLAVRCVKWLSWL